MNQSRRDLQKLPGRERGFLLLGAFTSIMVFSILSGAAVQEWSVIEKREREAQLIFIQEEFAAAISDYKKNAGTGMFPTKLEELTKESSTKGYFLRREYTDPMVRGAKFEDWCLLMLGGAGRVVSSCAEEDAEGSATDAFDSFGGSGSKSFKDPKGKKVDRSGYAEKSTSSPRYGKPGFQPGQESPAPGQQRIGGQAGAIFGVHSRCQDKAYDILERDDESYDLWYYTVQDFEDGIGKRLPYGTSPVQTNLPGSGGSKLDQKLGGSGGLSGTGSGSSTKSKGGRR